MTWGDSRSSIDPVHRVPRHPPLLMAVAVPLVVAPLIVAAPLAHARRAHLVANIAATHRAALVLDRPLVATVVTRVIAVRIAVSDATIVLVRDHRVGMTIDDDRDHRDERNIEMTTDEEVDRHRRDERTAETEGEINIRSSDQTTLRSIDSLRLLQQRAPPPSSATIQVLSLFFDPLPPPTRAASSVCCCCCCRSVCPFRSPRAQLTDRSGLRYRTDRRRDTRNSAGSTHTERQAWSVHKRAPNSTDTVVRIEWYPFRF